MPPTLPASILNAAKCRHHPSPLFIRCRNPHASFSRIAVPRSQILSPRSIFGAPRRYARAGLFAGGEGRSSLSQAAAGQRCLVAVGGDQIQKDAMGAAVDGSCKGEKEEGDDSRSKLLTLPTVLTLGRVASVPLLVSTFYMTGWWATTATTSIFVVAAVTDWLDGYLARKMHSGSAFGAFLDPVADKLMVAATLILLCTRPLDAAIFEGVPWLLTVPSIAIIGREITMSAVREWAASQDTGVLKAVAVNNLGKWKTASQMTALTILLTARDSSLSRQDGLVAAGVVLLYISAALALLSLVVYMRKIWRILLK